MASITATRREQLHATYMLAYHNFATDRSEVAAALGVSKNVASRLLKQLQGLGLVDSYDVNAEAQGQSRRGEYKELTWQCNETYDSATPEQAEATFAAAVDGAPVDPAAEQREIMALNKPGYDMYRKARAERVKASTKRDRESWAAVQEANREAYRSYKRAYTQLLAMGGGVRQQRAAA